MSAFGATTTWFSGGGNAGIFENWPTGAALVAVGLATFVACVFGDVHQHDGKPYS